MALAKAPLDCKCEMHFCNFLFRLFWVAFLKQSLNRLQVEYKKVHKSTRKYKEVLGSTSKYKEVFSRPQYTKKEEMFRLPLSQRVSFKTVLQKQNRLLVPKLVRWEYKVESSEVLKVTVTIVGLLGVRESFLAKMYKSGRIRIPELTLALLKRDEPSLEGCVMEVTLEPA